jgi:hypothetical protein
MTSKNDSSSNSSTGIHSDTWIRGSDIWLRARTNALAQEIASRSLKKIGDWIFIAQTIFVVVPIVLISLSLQITTIKLESSRVQEGQEEEHQSLTFPFTMDYRMLSVISIGSNGIALLLSFLSNRFRWTERALKHDELLAVYGLIAQKARRLEDNWMKPEEMRQYCGYLQDLFESTKNRGLEPSPENFRKAKKVLGTFNAYPFNLTQAGVREGSV